MKNKVKHNKQIRKGDKVMVIAGNDRGLVGTVLSRSLERITIQGVNVRKKHMKANQQNQQGGIIEIERPVHLSNVTLCLDDEKPRRTRIAYDKEGERLLVYKEGDTDVTYRAIKKGL